MSRARGQNETIQKKTRSSAAANSQYYCSLGKNSDQFSHRVLRRRYLPPWDHSVTRKRLVKDKSFAFPAARESSGERRFLRLFQIILQKFLDYCLLEDVLVEQSRREIDVTCRYSISNRDRREETACTDRSRVVVLPLSAQSFFFTVTQKLSNVLKRKKTKVRKITS